MTMHHTSVPVSIVCVLTHTNRGMPRQEFVDKLALRGGERVLDVGCGIGGGDFYMAAQHGAFVHGIDLSVNMVLIGLERAQQQNQTQVLATAKWRRSTAPQWHLFDPSRGCR